MTTFSVSTEARLNTPKDCLLRSFNVFKIDDPTAILNKLRFCLKPNTNVPDGDVDETVFQQKFRSDYTECTTEQNLKEELSVSVGIKGKYGVYSGSVQVDYTKEQSLSTTSFNSSYYARLMFGSVSYNKGRDEILALLDPKMVAELNAITNFQQAKAFTDNWNTHLVTNVSLGGSLFVGVQSNTRTIEEKTNLAVKVSAEYKAVASISAAADVINKIAKNETIKNVTQTIGTIGGDAVKASAIDPKDSKTFGVWANSCTKDSVYGIADTIEIHTLASDAAGKVLRKYIDLLLLQESLTHPNLFINTQSITAYNQIQVMVAPPSSEFKIVGGGAAVTVGSSSFLGSSYPVMDTGTRIGAWCATSHDCDIPARSGDMLSVYAFAVHDPSDYLSIKVETGKGSHTGIGGDEARATLGTEYTITCGGCRSEQISGGVKFMTASYPEDRQKWYARISDYKTPVPSTDVELTSYVVGIKSKDALLTVGSEIQQGANSHGQHGHSTSTVPDCICGGGVLVQVESGPGNLVQVSYPNGAKCWEEYNSDLAGLVSPASAWAYAIYLKADVKV